MRKAHATASEFFHQSSSVKAETRLLVAETCGSGKSLVGYNNLTVKELFRYRSGMPAQSATMSLVLDSEAVIGILHPLLRDVATACLDEALGISLDDVQPVQTSGLHGFDPSPLDYFHYPNTPEVASMCNCTEHVDRGLLHVVVASSTSGLQVLSEGGWRSVEKELVPFADAVVFTNCMMESIVEKHKLHRQQQCSSPDVVVHQQCALKACTHRVAKADQPRLSLSFELRLPFGCTGYPLEEQQGAAKQQGGQEQQGQRGGGDKAAAGGAGAEEAEGAAQMDSRRAAAAPPLPPPPSLTSPPPPSPTPGQYNAISGTRRSSGQAQQRYGEEEQ
jgi:hypothetical protein